MKKKRYNTAGRTRLAAYMKQTANEPPQNAEKIYHGLSLACSAEGVPVPGRSSVYRMLGALTETGEVQKFPAGKEESGYIYQHVGIHQHCDAHFHLHCLACGDVTHLECHCSDEVSDHLLAAHGFCVDRGRSVLYGVCAACSAKKVR